MKVILAPFTFTGDTPLSWHLNAKQKRNIEEAWDSPTEQIVDAKQDVFAALGCQDESRAEARK